MRTTKPISTISFNSEDFLKLKLNELQRAGRISFWAYVMHQPEDDEGGKKVHAHVFVEPSKMLQTDDLKLELMEYDPQCPTKPLGCISWHSSKFDPWYMYAIHDRRYLASKGQSRRYQYRADNVVSSDDDELVFRTKSIDLLALSPYEDMIDAQRQGLTWPEYFQRGTVPLPQVKLFAEAWNLLLCRGTDRGSDGSTHPDEAYSVNPDTGELIEQ